MIGEGELPDFEIFVERDEVASASGHAVVGGADGRVAHAVAAGIICELAARRLPGGRPEVATIVAKINVATAEIKGRIVVAIASEASQAGVAIERVAAGGVGDDAEISLAAEIIDPRQRGVRLSDYVFTIRIIKMTKFHTSGSRAGPREQTKA